MGDKRRCGGQKDVMPAEDLLVLSSVLTATQKDPIFKKKGAKKGHTALVPDTSRVESDCEVRMDFTLQKPII